MKRIKIDTNFNIASGRCGPPSSSSSSSSNSSSSSSSESSDSSNSSSSLSSESSGELGCPADLFCDTCPATLYTLTYSFSYVGGCAWFQDGGSGYIACVGGQWVMYIDTGTETCAYHKAALTYSCPTGVYDRDSGTCPLQVTVTS
ncbi:MAG: hypothetical protein AABY32_02300 [Nanoarchaeota archaeon]